MESGRVKLTHRTYLPYIMIVCDTSLPEEHREYSMYYDGISVPISRKMYDGIGAPIVLLDEDDIKV